MIDMNRRNMVSIDEIPLGSQFRVLDESIHVSEEDIKKAERWWKSLGKEQKVKIYQDIQDAIHGICGESIE